MVGIQLWTGMTGRVWSAVCCCCCRNKLSNQSLLDPLICARLGAGTDGIRTEWAARCRSALVVHTSYATIWRSLFSSLPTSRPSRLHHFRPSKMNLHSFLFYRIFPLLLFGLDAPTAFANPRISQRIPLSVIHQRGEGI